MCVVPATDPSPRPGDLQGLTFTRPSPLSTVSDWDPKPIGIASIAQVHLATDRETGQRVAVKLQHPNLEEWHAVECVLFSLPLTDPSVER